MGVSDGLGAEPEIDCSVGAIVWVRRRNGSWWPGRILGPEELSASHVMSPRSGTPVKLLGREDASVDWYNLEKSKRVKAFRCGEFDDCIERAESSQGVPIKKREKYARREDAILHALELEKQHLEKRQQKSSIPNSTNHKTATASRKELANCSPSENYTGINKTREHSKSVSPKTQPPLGRLDSSVEDGREYSHQSVQRAKHAKQQSWEDDNPEAMPRMRGLQDFGLRIASSKRKVSADSHLHALPIGGQNTGVGGDTSCGKNSSAIKKKRTQGGLSEEPLAKKRDRRRPLLQVLQSSAKLPDLRTMQSDSTTVSVSMQGDKEHADGIYRAKRSRCVYLPSDPQEYVDLIGSSLDKMQRCTSQHEVDNCPSLAKGISSPRLVAVQESDSERDLSNPELGKEASGLSDPTTSGRYGSHSSSVFTLQEPDNMDGEELNESELSGFVSPLHSHEQTPTVSADIGGSNWQLKGKRNIRNLIKRPVEKDSVNRVDKCNGALQESIHEDKDMDGQIGMRHVVYQRHGRLNRDYDEGCQFENDSGQNSMLGFGNRRYRMSKASNMTDLDEDSYEMSPSSWEADRMSQLPLKYQRDSDGFFEPIYTAHLGPRMGPMLMDVDLKVQASYQGERVPLVSLMSRLNGKAIVGHPIQIEKMEDGSSNLILSKHAVCDERPDSDGNTGLPPVWRTARRTTMHRVPRTHASSALEGEEVDPHQYSDFESRPQQKKQFSNHGYKEKLVKKSYIHQSLTEKNSPKKIFKKINSSSQKIRTLSSIATDQKPSGKSSDHKLSGKDCDSGVLIKSEKTAPPLACIPVKLVFSRILEAVGRPSMAQEATYRISTAGPADSNPVDKTSE